MTILAPRMGRTSYAILTALREGGPTTARGLTIGYAPGTVRTALWRLEERGYVIRRGAVRYEVGKRTAPLFHVTAAGREALQAQALSASVDDQVVARVCGYLAKAVHPDMTDAGSKTLAAMALADLRGMGEQAETETEQAA